MSVVSKNLKDGSCSENNTDPLSMESHLESFSRQGLFGLLGCESSVCGIV